MGLSVSHLCTYMHTYSSALLSGGSIEQDSYDYVDLLEWILNQWAHPKSVGVPSKTIVFIAWLAIINHREPSGNIITPSLPLAYDLWYCHASNMEIPAEVLR